MSEIAGNQLALSAVRPLVVGVEPFAGECLSSVLVRACEANIFTKTLNLLHLIGLHAQASESVPFAHASAAPSIAKLLGTTAAQIESRMHPAVPDDFGRSTVDWFGGPVERRYVEAKVRRFAPHSLEEHAHVPAIWSIRLLDYCPTTLERLASECPRCLRPLGWRACRSLFECERCGASLLRTKASILPVHLHDCARLGAALVSPVATARQAALSSLPAPFSTWAPADALVGLLTLGEAQLSLQPSNLSNSQAGAAANIAAGIEFAKHWPGSLSEFVKTATARHSSTSVRSGLGPLGKLFTSSAMRTPIRDLVRSTISTSLGEAIVPAKLFSGGTVNGACRQGMITTLEASKQLGMNMRRLRRLEGRSETFLVRHNVHGGAALYDEAAISSLREALDHSVKPAVCARQLGIPHYCVEAFASAGLVEIIKNPDAVIITGGSLISKTSIAAMRERLQGQSLLVTSGVSLREAMRRNGDPRDWVAIFASMLSGLLRFQIAGDDKASITDGLTVERTDVDRILSRRNTGSPIDGINVSCQTAAKLIGTTQQFISAAVKVGFLEGEVRKRTFALPLQNVLMLQKHFVLADELRETFGMHQTIIVRQLREGGLQPAATINRTTVWRRPDIEKFIDEQSYACLAGD